ncbi:hypothetical protein CYMTET_16138 [Cymbomonas tetramitiformis]|uniref:Uncharacterized protein n=1 Tax=Cymbomonas tetramitiformis TaxID=36881 RepID=A0AAE0L8B3_9CHLO|nr:hypothetical protein CYMTET_16138 [Cymbomonas tetramitiformis]
MRKGCERCGGMNFVSLVEDRELRGAPCPRGLVTHSAREEQDDLSAEPASEPLRTPAAPGDPGPSSVNNPYSVLGGLGPVDVDFSTGHTSSTVVGFTTPLGAEALRPRRGGGMFPGDTLATGQCCGFSVEPRSLHPAVELLSKELDYWYPSGSPLGSESGLMVAGEAEMISPMWGVVHSLGRYRPALHYTPHYYLAGSSAAGEC